MLNDRERFDLLGTWNILWRHRSVHTRSAWRGYRGLHPRRPLDPDRTRDAVGPGGQGS
jgi:hypothetical protein